MSDGWGKYKISKVIENHMLAVGMLRPTEVQRECMVNIMEGKNGIVISRTGTGKTACYVIPMLSRLSRDIFGVFGVVLAPTRELVSQIAEQFTTLGSGIRVKVLACSGGISEVTQGVQLTYKPHVVVSTPGRLKILLRDPQHANSLANIKMVVLDEADMLLEEGEMLDSIAEIIQHLPPRNQFQIVALSATLSDDLENFISTKDKLNAFFWKEPTAVLTVDSLKQYYRIVPPIAKDAHLVHLLQLFLNIPEMKLNITKVYKQIARLAQPLKEKITRQAIIFTSSCWNCQILYELLSKLSFRVSSLHSAMPQVKRKNSYNKFKSCFTQILVCTDLASRGLDLPYVTLVINDSLPLATQNYIHRVGRTSRAGRTGTSITLISPHDYNRLVEVEQILNCTMQDLPVTNEKYILKLTKSLAVLRKLLSHDIKKNIHVYMNNPFFANKLLKTSPKL